MAAASDPLPGVLGSTLSGLVDMYSVNSVKLSGIAFLIAFIHGLFMVRVCRSRLRRCGFRAVGIALTCQLSGCQAPMGKGCSSLSVPGIRVAYSIFVVLCDRLDYRAYLYHFWKGMLHNANVKVPIPTPPSTREC